MVLSWCQCFSVSMLQSVLFMKRAAPVNCEWISYIVFPPQLAKPLTFSERWISLIIQLSCFIYMINSTAFIYLFIFLNKSASPPVPGGSTDLNNSKRHLCTHAGTNIAPRGTFYINLHTNELNTKQTQVAHEHHNLPFFSQLVQAT